MFYYPSNIKSFTFGDSVEYIPADLCKGLTALTTFEIPNSVTSIGSRAFSSCEALTSVTIQAENPPTIEDDTFGDDSRSISIKVPCGSIEKYKTAKYWNEFENIAEPKFPFLVNINSNNVAMGYAEITNQDCRNNEVIIVATPNKGYHFVKWSDGNTENPRTIIVTEDLTLTAEFAINQYLVEIKSNGNGSVIGSGSYDYGTEIIIEAIADKGYHFAKWSDGNTENPRTIIVTEDITLSAEFELDETPVENVTDNSVLIYSKDNKLYVEGAKTDYYVLDMAGRLIYSGRDTQVQLPRGVYVININGELQKVVL